MAYPAVMPDATCQRAAVRRCGRCQNSRATSTARHGPYLLVRVRVRPERHRAQSCAIALRSPAPERSSRHLHQILPSPSGHPLLSGGRYSPDIPPRQRTPRSCRWSRSLAVPATGLRARWPRTGVRGLHGGHCAATTARRELIIHMLIALQMWRNNVFQSTCCNFACG
jgi:hypothetical protein